MDLYFYNYDFYLNISDRMLEVNSLVEDLKKSLECPVCFNIPRSINYLI